jgi:predicted RNA methylase
MSDLDFYETPLSASFEVVRELKRFLPDHRPARVLDPGCGTGKLGAAVRRYEPDAELYGVELDPTRARIASAVGYATTWAGNFIEDPRPAALPAHYDMVICNPPFTYWQEFTDRILTHWAHPATLVAVLGRVSMLGAQKRHDWWEYGHGAGVKLRILSGRPDFTGGGGDNSEYAWFIWNLPQGKAIRWYKGRITSDYD